jgi:hypothetical protein
MLRLGAALAAGATVALVGAFPASAGVPVDPNAKGYIGLCDQSGHNVTSGSLSQHPFVWKAVASVPAPAAVQGRGQNAVLAAYQLRPGVDPGEWSGDFLTGTSFYYNSKLPAVVGTTQDNSMAVITAEFPPMENGEYELRMFFASIDGGQYTVTYPATYIQVTGNTWKVLTGGQVDCGAATAKSQGVLMGNVAPAATRAPQATTTTQPGSGGSSSKPGGNSSHGGATSSAGGQTVDGQPAATSTASHDSSGTALLWTAVVVAVVGVAGGLIAWRRRNRIPSSL